MQEIGDVSERLDRNYSKPTGYHDSAPYKGLKRSTRKEIYREALHLYEGLLYEVRMIKIYVKVSNSLAAEVSEIGEEVSIGEKIEK